ncbi:MAG: hypothetical protein SPF22_04030 [Candidatus Onthovivens sp.]|nr:hypothetical protein [Candidatus Onthovivens sp.]
MAEKNRQILQHLRTTGNTAYVQENLQSKAAQGEIAIQYDGTEASGTSLWTLAKDGKKAVQFVNKEQVADMIKNGAVAEVDKIETAVGLAEDGTYIPKSGTNYLNGATTVEGEIDALDKALNGVQNQINGMDAASVADDNKIVSDVIQTDGKITASTKNVTEVKLGGYTVGGDDSGKVAATDTLGQALGKLQGQINGMDKAASAADGQVVTTISEEDGKVFEVKANVKDLQLGGYEKDANATGAIASTDTINAALSKLENKANAITISNDDKSINVTSGADGTVINVNIKSGEKVIRKDDVEGGLYTDLNLVKISTGLPTTVKERYELHDSYGAKIGESIDIAKDSHIVSITYITDSSDEHYQNLEYKYIDVNGAEQTAYVDISSLVLEAEFKDGLEVVDHQVKAKIDAESEKDSQNAPVSFLTVGPDGLKLSGIKDEITRNIKALDVTDAAEAGKYVSAVNETDGKVSMTRANVSDAVLNGYSKGEKPTDTAITATDKLKDAIAKLEHQIDAAKAAATTKVVEGTDEGNNMTIVPTTGDDKSVTYTVNLTDVASKAALDAEIAARKAVDGQAGQTYVANANANYIKAVDSLNAADVQLDAILGKDTSAGAGNSGNTVFDTTNTVAKNISDIKKDLAAFKNKLTLSVNDDDKYIATNISSDENGTVITVSAIKKDIATSTNTDSAIADSYNVKRFAVSKIKADEGVAHHASGVEIVDSETNDGFKQLSFAKLTIDCGEF